MQEYLVTVRVVAYRNYFVQAADYESAEDYAIEEAMYDVFQTTDDDVQLEAYDIQTQ